MANGDYVETTYGSFPAYWDPDQGEYVNPDTGEAITTSGGTPITSNNLEDKGWIKTAISGGAAVLSSALGLAGKVFGGNGTEEQQQQAQTEEQNQILGMDQNTFLMLAGGGALVWYLTR